MLDLQHIQDIDKLESQLYFNWIDDLQFKYQLTLRVKSAKQKRTVTQQWLANVLNISLTKIKEIEKGTCKDINAINNYINFLGENMVFV